MSQRSKPQKHIDENAFPVRIKVQVSEYGSGASLDLTFEWLDKNLERADYAWHSGGRNVFGDVSHYYFRDAAVADRFIRDLELELADGTISKTYRSPSIPFGRRI